MFFLIFIFFENERRETGVWKTGKQGKWGTICAIFPSRLWAVGENSLVGEASPNPFEQRLRRWLRVPAERFFRAFGPRRDEGIRQRSLR